MCFALTRVRSYTSNSGTLFSRLNSYAKINKKTQIARTKRLLQTLSPDQKPSFEAMLAQSMSDRNEIKKELDPLHQILSEQTDS